MYITLESGGSRPPTSSEALQIRTALGCAQAPTRENYAFADSPVSLVDEDLMVFVDATAGNVVLNLPAITAIFRTITIKRVDETANTVTVQPEAADLAGTVRVDGETSQGVGPNSACDIRSNTTQWWTTSYTVNGAIGAP